MGESLAAFQQRHSLNASSCMPSLQRPVWHGQLDVSIRQLAENECSSAHAQMPVARSYGSQLRARAGHAADGCLASARAQDTVYCIKKPHMILARALTAARRLGRPPAPAASAAGSAAGAAEATVPSACASADSPPAVASDAAPCADSCSACCCCCCSDCCGSGCRGDCGCSGCINAPGLPSSLWAAPPMGTAASSAAPSVLTAAATSSSSLGAAAVPMAPPAAGRPCVWSSGRAVAAVSTG